MPRRPTRSSRPGPARREGQIFAFDKPNRRVIALAKVDGKYIAQYRLAGNAPDWDDMRAMYIIPGVDPEPSTLVWMSRDGVHQAILVAVPDVGPVVVPSPSAGASGGVERDTGAEQVALTRADP